jgi:serine/threonine protein kinase
VSLENVVLADKGTRAYLADLGSVCTTAVPVPSRGYRGKLEYAAPEIFLDKHVDALGACDILMYVCIQA